jgi:hypothetical protein
MKKPLIQYMSHPHYPKHRVGCLVALIRPDGKIGIGWSQCCPKDNFSKEEGRKRATFRALYGDKGVKPVSYRFYNPDGSYVKKDVLSVTLNAFRFRALQYFAPNLADDVPIGNIKITVAISPDPAVVKG